VGVEVFGRISSNNNHPPPQPSPTRGEGAHRAWGTRRELPFSCRFLVIILDAGETPMLPQRSVTVVQLLGAALGIPAAVAGSYSAYQTYFSNDAVCDRLRTTILATMERKLPLEAKQALLRKDVADFDQTCGARDPDARAVFQAAMQERPATPKPRVHVATADGQLPSAAASPAAQPTPLFGTAGPGQRAGWIALSRQEAGALVSNFEGYAVSETSLLPIGTVLTAQWQLPVLTEPQRATVNDASRLQAMLPARACVRVLATQPGTGRLWAQVAPASCNGWVALGWREGGAWVANFHGAAISETAPPPAGTVLSAERQLPVWSEPQLAAANDQTKLQNMLPARACVRVLTTRPGAGRLWAEVAPAACS